LGHIAKARLPSISNLKVIQKNLGPKRFSPEIWPAAHIRATFIGYFAEKRGHTFVPSSPVVPHDDPTLLFTNAGMNQFKPIFLGQVDPKSELYGMKSAVNSQKCIRAGGKHNDLDDVGKDVYHHTFFEMLGNWSFGDYFKTEAIAWSFECLTEVFGLDPDRLYATYFGGDESLGLPADTEARELWLKYLPAERILPFGKKDNFWEMGDQGPCGPCTEIHYDRIGGRDASALVNADLPDVLEIWNNVFIQFNRDEKGLQLLPDKHVDTGMGFERLASILQGYNSNYDTDVFTPLFDAIRRETGAAEYTGKLGSEDVGTKDMAYRVVADHLRTLTFAITDGAMPSNEGRGYVLRRIVRRGVRYGKQFLGAKPGFLSRLIPDVVKIMKNAFPELIAKEEDVVAIIVDEEESFGRTIEKGLAEFEKRAKMVQDAGGSIFTGEDAFYLYDTMGFPLDLTQLMAEERAMSVDKVVFEELMQAQKKNSQSNRKTSSKSMVLKANETSYLSSEGVAATDYQLKYQIDHQPSATVKAIFTGNGFVKDANCDVADIGIVMDRTSFYAEAGGQVYDTGVLASTDGKVSIRIDSVQSFGAYVLHTGVVESGEVKVSYELMLLPNVSNPTFLNPDDTIHQPIFFPHI
jgi:alanyl-tRNA synthetase